MGFGGLPNRQTDKRCDNGEYLGYIEQRRHELELNLNSTLVQFIVNSSWFKF
jgi:hypothetical protein